MSDGVDAYRLDRDLLMPPAGFLRRYVDLYEPIGEASPEAHLGAALGLLSAAAGPRVRIRFGEHTEYATLYVMLVGASGEAHKSTVLGGAKRMVQAVMEETKKDTGITARIRTDSIGHASSRGLVNVLGTKNEEERNRWFREGPPGWLLTADEIGPLVGLRKSDRGHDWREGTRDVLLESYGGFQGGVMTGSDRILPGPCAVSIVGATTPGELQDRLRPESITSGFLGRWTIVADPPSGRFISRPSTLSSDQEGEREKLVWWLMAMSEGSKRGYCPNVFDAMTGEAKELRDEWYEDTKRELGARRDTEGDEGSAGYELMLFNRYQSTAVRLAGLYAASMLDLSTKLGDLEVDADAVEWGQTIVDHVRRAVMGQMDHAEDHFTDKWQRRVLRYLDGQGGGVLRSRLVDRVKGLETRKALDTLDIMAEVGRVVIRERKGKRGPGAVWVYLPDQVPEEG